MSHRAMNWALEKRHLKPAPWRVLVMLADRHNKDTLRVDPEQALLAHDCNMARSTINRHLDDLEIAGLLVRVQRVNPKTQKQIPTFYVLEIDFAKPPHIEFAVSDYETRIRDAQNGNTGSTRVPNPDTGAVSQKTAIPCPKKHDSRVPNPDTNLVKEPVKEPNAGEPAGDGLDLFEKFFGNYPNAVERRLAEREWDKALERGADPRSIVAAAAAYAQTKEVKRGFAKKPANWLSSDAWQTGGGVATNTPTKAEIDAFAAKAIIGGNPSVARHYSTHRVAELVHAGLLTTEDCKRAGVQL